MQQPQHWSTIDAMENGRSEFFYHLRTDQDHYAGYGTNSLQNQQKTEELWAEQTRLGNAPPQTNMPIYSDFSSSTMTPSPQIYHLGSTIESVPEYARSPPHSMKHSPALTESSLASDALPISTMQPTPIECYPPSVTGLGYSTDWKNYNQHSYPVPTPISGTQNYHCPDRWQVPDVKYEDASSQPDSECKELSDLDDEPVIPEKREAMVQAILDRTRRTKTTDENAKYRCEECNRGFQRIYNLRSHMNKHVATRTKVRCEHRDCSKEFDRKTDLARHERSVSVKIFRMV